MGSSAAKLGIERLSSFGVFAESTDVASSSYFHRKSALESSLYMRNQLLRDSDWASMAHSVELRLPLVDVPLTRSLPRIAAVSPSGKETLGRAPSKPVPSMILNQPKTGSAVPVGEWMNPGTNQKDMAHGYSRVCCKSVASATFGGSA